MTYDEAMKISYETVHREAMIVSSSVSPEQMKMLAKASIDRFVALGMLKLEQPVKAKSVRSRAIGTLNRCLDLSDHSSGAVFDALDRAGLKIVEK